MRGSPQNGEKIKVSSPHLSSIRPSDCKGWVFCRRESCCLLCRLTFWDGQALGSAAIGILLKRERAHTAQRRLRGPRSLPSALQLFQPGQGERHGRQPAHLVCPTPTARKDPALDENSENTQSGSPSGFVFLRRLPKTPGWSHHRSASPTPGSSSPPAPLLRRHKRAFPTTTALSHRPSLASGPQRDPIGTPRGPRSRNADPRNPASPHNPSEAPHCPTGTTKPARRAQALPAPPQPSAVGYGGAAGVGSIQAGCS